MNQQEAKKLEKKTLETLKKYISKNDRVVAGISGGPDSIFLLHILKQIPCGIIVAHINHKLRKESDSEEEFVKNTSTNLDFHSKKTDIKALSKKFKKGLEETGRKIRYEFFQKLAEKHKAKYIITAHHADDNLETVIMNLSRGASLQGLSGMEELQKLDSKNQENNTFLLRPLLSFSKKQILNYLKFHEIKFCKDKSNRDTSYNRNFVRLKIIPELKKVNPRLTETIAKNSQNIRETNVFLKKTANTWISKNLREKSQEKFLKLNARSFRENSNAIQKIIILNIYENLIGNTKNIESAHLEEVLKIINQNIGNKSKKLGKVIVSIRQNTLKIESFS